MSGDKSGAKLFTGTVIASLIVGAVAYFAPDKQPDIQPRYLPCGVEFPIDERGLIPPLDYIFAEPLAQDLINGYDLEGIMDANGITTTNLPSKFDEERDLYCLEGTVRRLQGLPPIEESSAKGNGAASVQEAPSKPAFRKFFYDGQPLDPENFAEGAAQYFPTIEKAAKKYNLDPNLIASVITQESAWLDSVAYGHVLSSVGAVGLMQVMPSDGKAANHPCKCFWDRPTIAQLSDPTFNIMYGSKVLRDKINAAQGITRDGLKEYGAVYEKEKDAYDYADIVLQIYRVVRRAEDY